MVDTSAAEPCAAAGMGDGPGPAETPVHGVWGFLPGGSSGFGVWAGRSVTVSLSGATTTGPLLRERALRISCGADAGGVWASPPGGQSELCRHHSRTPGRPTFRERQTQERAEAPLRAGGSVARERGSRAAACRRPWGQASSGPVTVDPPRCLPVSHLRAGRASGTAQACPVPAPPVWAGGGGSEGPLGRNLAFQKDLT